MSQMDDFLRRLEDLHRRLGAQERLESSGSGLPANVAKFSGTPTAGRLAQFTGAGTIEQTTYASSAVARYSGVPVAGNYAYWTANGTVADSGFGTSQLPRYSGAPSAGQLAYWTANGTVTAWTSGTADLMLLSGNQTVGGVKTFSDGIAFANETLSAYDEGTWSPAITGSSSNPTIAYTTQSGKYTRIGNVVFFSILIVINTVSGGSGTCRISLPSTVTSINTVAGVVISGPDATGTPFAIAAETESGQAYANIRLINDNAGLANLAVTDLAAGDLIRVSGFYFVA